MLSGVGSTPAETEFVTFGPVHLDVVSLDDSLGFWRDLVGLQVVVDGSDAVELGVDGRPLVVLRAGAISPVRRGYAGLFHLAINLPDEPAFAHVLARLLASGHPIGTTDHIVAKSIYVGDPDGIGLELALETPERVKVFHWTDAEPVIIDADGRRRAGAEPLDVEQVLAAQPDADLSQPLASETKVGHVHLQVSDLGRAYAFYRDRLGFPQSNYVRAIGYGDLGAGGRLTHRVAVNVWQGAGVPPRPRGMAGMSRFTIRFDSPERLHDVLARLDGIEQQADSLLAHDPDGNTMALSA